MNVLNPIAVVGTNSWGSAAYGKVTVPAVDTARAKEVLEADGYNVELVSGIPSFCAAAAVLKTSLTEWDQELHVIPALHNTEGKLELPGSYVLMKSASHMADVKEMLRRSGHVVQGVENCTMENQRIYRSLEEIPDDAGYFSLLIAKEPE